MQEEFNVGECNVCGQGLLVIACDNKSNSMLIICDDCESQWHDPKSFISGQDPITNEYKSVRDATKEDIVNKGWWDYVRNPG